MFGGAETSHGLFDLRRTKGAPDRRLFDFRGAKVTRGEGGSELEIFTGRTTVVIFAHKRMSPSPPPDSCAVPAKPGRRRFSRLRPRVLYRASCPANASQTEAR